MDTRVPEYAQGRELPDIDCPSYVVHLREPFLIALIDIRVPGGLHLHAWPDIRSHASDEELLTTMLKLAGGFLEAEKGLVFACSEWSYSFGSLKVIPKHLFLDCFPDVWEGVLRLAEPRGIWEIDPDYSKVTMVRWLGAEPPEAKSDGIATASREVCNYLTDFLNREEQLTIDQEKEEEN